MRHNCLIYRAVHKCKPADRACIYICQWLHLQAFTNVLFHVERIYKCNHAGGQAGQDKRAPQRAGQVPRGPAPQGLGKYQECLPPRAGQAPRVPAPQGLGKGREVAVERSGVATFRAFPSPWDKQSRGLPRHLAGSLGACPALGTNNRAACRATLQALLVLAQPFGIDKRAACRATSALLSSPACPPATHHAPPDELRLGLLV